MKQTILLVEDDHIQNDVLANFLRKEKYEVCSAYTLAEASKYLADKKIHLIILDLRLPDGNGLDFLADIRRRMQVPVIVLTALDDEYTQIRSFDLKADEYVDKPVSPVVMTKRVKALMGRLYGEETPVQIGGCQFDFARYQVTDKAGQPISLTTREFSILRLLYENHGRVVTREQILDSVWGPEYCGEDRLIDTHIKNIRKKLGMDIVTTVKGVGYRIAPAENQEENS